MERKDLKESSIFKGYYYPKDNRFKDLVVNKEGLVINLKTSRELKRKVGSWGYYVVGSFLLHVILADTFLEKVNPDFVVNHKDGNKLNIDIDNLEWVSRSYNADHAYKTGLRNDNIEIDCLNLETKEEHRFHSLQECARYLNINAGKISIALRKNTIRWSPKGIFCFKSSTDSWPDILPHYTSDFEGYSGYTYITKYENSVFLFKQLSEVCSYYGLNYKTIQMRFNRSMNHETWINNILIARSDSESFNLLKPLAVLKTTMPIKFENKKTKPPEPIRVTFHESGLVKDYSSSQKFSDELGIKKNTVQKGFYIGNGNWRNMSLQYLNRPNSQ